MTIVIHVLTRLGSVVTSAATAHLHRLRRLLAADAVSTARVAGLLAAMMAVGTAGAHTGQAMATSFLVVGAIGVTWLTLWTTTGRG